ncbi:hypothetical protein Anas_04063, partial [Armadillidium nasatum]
MSNNSVNIENVPGGQAPPKNKSNFYRGRGKYNTNWSKRGHWRGNYRGRGNFNPQNSRSSSQSFHSSQSSTCSQKDIRVMLPPVNCPYKGWHLYMKEAYREELESVRIVKVFEEYFRKNSSLLSDTEEKISFQIDIQKVLEEENIKEKITNLYDMIINSPQKVINMFGLAAHQ